MVTEVGKEGRKEGRVSGVATFEGRTYRKEEGRKEESKGRKEGRRLTEGR
jgi:hypothetical protein